MKTHGPLIPKLQGFEYQSQNKDQKHLEGWYYSSLLHSGLISCTWKLLSSKCYWSLPRSHEWMQHFFLHGFRITAELRKKRISNKTTIVAVQLKSQIMHTTGVHLSITKLCMDGHCFIPHMSSEGQNIYPYYSRKTKAYCCELLWLVSIKQVQMQKSSHSIFSCHEMPKVYKTADHVSKDGSYSCWQNVKISENQAIIIQSKSSITA